VTAPATLEAPQVRDEFAAILAEDGHHNLESR
jgi:hypothetical protein